MNRENLDFSINQSFKNTPVIFVAFASFCKTYCKILEKIQRNVPPDTPNLSNTNLVPEPPCYLPSCPSVSRVRKRRKFSRRGFRAIQRSERHVKSETSQKLSERIVGSIAFRFTRTSTYLDSSHIMSSARLEIKYNEEREPTLRSYQHEHEATSMHVKRRNCIPRPHPLLGASTAKPAAIPNH